MSFSYKENSDCEFNFGLCLVCRIIVGGIRGGILNWEFLYFCFSREDGDKRKRFHYLFVLFELFCC